MSSFQLNLTRAATRKGRRRAAAKPPTVPLTQTKSAFADNSDSDSSSPRAPLSKKVSTVVTAIPASSKSQTSKTPPTTLPSPAPTGPKASQIARLVERRRSVKSSLQVSESREAHDEALFRYDVDRCAEQPASDGYAQRPVEGFGEMMLRGMGWNGPDSKNEKKAFSDPVARPSRLGLGAKFTDSSSLPGKRPRVGNANAASNDVKGRREKLEGDNVCAASHILRNGKYEMREGVSDVQGSDERDMKRSRLGNGVRIFTDEARKEHGVVNFASSGKNDNEFHSEDKSLRRRYT